jgi:methionyl aminopeptidase
MNTEGYHGDNAATFPVGKIDSASQELIDATKKALHRGIEAVRPGAPVKNIGAAIRYSMYSDGPHFV